MTADDKFQRITLDIHSIGEQAEKRLKQISTTNVLVLKIR